MIREPCGRACRAKRDEYKREAKRRKVEEQNRLYDLLQLATQTRIDRIAVLCSCIKRRKHLMLLIDAGADRKNVSAFSGKSIRQHYENGPVWQICGILWDERKMIRSAVLMPVVCTKARASGEPLAAEWGFRPFAFGAKGLFAHIRQAYGKITKHLIMRSLMIVRYGDRRKKNGML